MSEICVITEPCFNCKYTDCLVVCPVECFYEGESMLFINPEECVACDACIPECPVDAIYNRDQVPEQWTEYIQLNEELCKTHPHITERQNGMFNADHCQP